MRRMKSESEMRTHFGIRRFDWPLGVLQMLVLNVEVIQLAVERDFGRFQFHFTQLVPYVRMDLFNMLFSYHVQIIRDNAILRRRLCITTLSD